MQHADYKQTQAGLFSPLPALYVLAWFTGMGVIGIGYKGLRELKKKKKIRLSKLIRTYFTTLSQLYIARELALRFSDTLWVIIKNKITATVKKDNPQTTVNLSIFLTRKHSQI